MGQCGDWTELKAGAFYALLVDHHISRDEVERIVAGWRDHGPDSKLIVLDGGMKIEELDDDRLRELGLARIEEA
jgi:hypothetical protein